MVTAGLTGKEGDGYFPHTTRGQNILLEADLQCAGVSELTLDTVEEEQAFMTFHYAAE